MPRRFESLDGLRGICALVVVLFHCDTVLHTGHLFNHGYLCVDVFFVLSGFVIAHTYETRLGKELGFLAFLKVRGWRLLPVHFVGTGIVSLLAVVLWANGLAEFPGFTWPVMLAAVMLGLLMIPQMLVPGGPFPLNPVLWSLWGEWIANIVYGLGVHTARTRILIAVATFAWGVAGYHALHDPLGWMSGMSQHDITGVIGRSLGGFFAGMCLLRAYRNGLIAKLPSLAPELVFALWLALFAAPLHKITPLYDMIVIILITPMMIALLVRSDRKIHPIFVRLGALSYPLYASHLALMVAAAAYFVRSRPPHSVFFALPLTAGALALAWFVDRAAHWMVSAAQRKSRPVGNYA